jgi:hypothetical protein
MHGVHLTELGKQCVCLVNLEHKLPDVVNLDNAGQLVR